MPNKLRLRTAEEIAETMTLALSRRDLYQVAYEENLFWINDVGLAEVEESYSNRPEWIYKPSLSQQLDDIFKEMEIKLNNSRSFFEDKVLALYSSWYWRVDLPHRRLKLDLEEIRGR